MSDHDLDEDDEDFDDTDPAWDEVIDRARILVAGDRAEYAARAALVLLRCAPLLRATDVLLSIETARFAEPALRQLARKDRLTDEASQQFRANNSPIVRELSRVPLYGTGELCVAREFEVTFWMFADECAQWSVGASRADFVLGVFCLGQTAVNVARDLWSVARSGAAPPSDDDFIEADDVEREFALRLLDAEQLETRQRRQLERALPHRALREIDPPTTGWRRWFGRVRR